MSFARTLTWALPVGAIVGLTNPTVAQQRNQNFDYLTTEEANRPAEEWTLKQILDKGWTPYECFFDQQDASRALFGTRWPTNDPDSTRLGACVTYSFMPTGVGMEVGEGPNTWPGSMPVGAAAAFATAATTWEGVADVHLTHVTDGGGVWNVGGPTGLKGNIRVGAGTIASGALAHGYYPPPNGVSAAGDVHFDDGFVWVTSGAAPGSPFDVETVSLHELGHALGLDHVGTVAGDVMFPTYNGIKTAPAAGDIAFMTAIYGAGPHVAQCGGACCFSKTVCGDRTQIDCTNQGGTWRGAGTKCPTQNVFTAQHSSGPVVHWANPAMDCFTLVLRRGPTTSGCIPGVPIDAWSTSEDPLTPTCHNFGPFPESPPIPADFFGPGSDPFQGEICLRGEPVGPTKFGDYGDADTLILRSADPFDRCELPLPQARTVDIEIVALSLISIGPIDVLIQGQPTQWDVFVDLSVVGIPALGQMTVTKTHCNGGTYNSILIVQPRFTFTKVGGSPVVPDGTQRILDTGLEGIPAIQLLQETDPPWTHDLDPGHGLFGGGEGCSGFHPGIEDPTNAQSCDCNNTGSRDDCDIESGLSLDCNANGIPDECEPDADGDGIPDDCDNCPDHPNPGQLDADGNSVGDLCQNFIPTVSQWGLLVMTLLLLAGGALILARRNSVSTSS